MESILDILWSPEDDWDENDPDWIQIVCVEICCATGINVASDCLNLPATVGTCCDHLPILCGQTYIVDKKEHKGLSPQIGTGFLSID